MLSPMRHALLDADSIIPPEQLLGTYVGGFCRPWKNLALIWKTCVHVPANLLAYHKRPETTLYGTITWHAPIQI